MYAILAFNFKDIKTINKNFVAHAQGKTLAPTKLGRTKK